MRRLYPPALTSSAADQLAELQRDVDGEQSYEQRVARCKHLWERKTSRVAWRAAFDEVREKLTSMSAGQRCHYCEDSCADEIEHMRPKDLYPEDAFSWDNYVYACGPCNGPKSNKFAVIDAAGELIDVTRGRSDPVTPPAPGAQALINPRGEDPFDFISLDLHDTFTFLPRDEPGDPTIRRRAGYTLDVLRLNARENLVEQRRKACVIFTALLGRYAQIRQQSPNATSSLDELRGTILCADHQSVWIAMQRQARAGIAPTLIRQLFAIAPEALDW